VISPRVPTEQEYGQGIPVQGEVSGKFFQADKGIALQQKVLLLGARRKQSVEGILLFLQGVQGVGLLVCEGE